MPNNLNKKLMLVAFLMTSLCANAQQVSFSHAWTLLQEKNNSLAAQRANVQHYQQLKKADESLNYPSITLGANYTRLDDDVTLSGEQIINSLDDSSQASLAGLSSLFSGTDINFSELAKGTSTVIEKDMFNSSIRAIWPIYTGGRITAAHDYAAGRSDQAAAQLELETHARYQDLSRYYYSVVLAKAVINTRKSVENGLIQHRYFSIKLEQQGQIARVERLQAEASLAKAIVDRKKAERDLDMTSSALTEILNQTTPVVPLSQLFINRSLPPLEAFTEQTLMTYPGLDILEAKQKQATSAVKAEKGKYHPEVYLYGDYSLYENDSLASEMTPDWFVGIGVNIPLFDNTGRSSKVQAAHSTILQVRYLYQQAKQDLTMLVKRTYFEAQQAIEEVQGLDASLALAEENLKLRKKVFTQGLSPSIDVVDAELFLSSIKIQQQLAKFNYIIALHKLLALSNDMSTFNQYELTALKSNKSKDEK